MKENGIEIYNVLDKMQFRIEVARVDPSWSANPGWVPVSEWGTSETRLDGVQVHFVAPDSSRTRPRHYRWTNGLPWLTLTLNWAKWFIVPGNFCNNGEATTTLALSGEISCFTIKIGLICSFVCLFDHVWLLRLSGYFGFLDCVFSSNAFMHDFDCHLWVQYI